MSDLRKVDGPSSPVDRHLRLIGAIIALILVVVIAKPWGTSRQSSASVATPAPSPTPSPTPVVPADRRDFEFTTFLPNEPPPGWEIWSAGHFASFYFAMRIEVAPTAVGATPGPQGSATPDPSDPVGSLAAVPTTWPTIHIPGGSSLSLLGLDLPMGRSVESATLVRLDDGGPAVRAVIGTSPWPAHFAIIGVAGGGQDAMRIWPVGRYRLDLAIAPGGVRRSLEIDVEPGPAPSTVPSGNTADP